MTLKESKIPDNKGSDDIDDKNKGGRPKTKILPYAKENCFGCFTYITRTCKECSLKKRCKKELNRRLSKNNTDQDCKLSDFDEYSNKCESCDYYLNCKRLVEIERIRLALVLKEYDSKYVMKTPTYRSIREKTRYKISEPMKRLIIFKTEQFLFKMFECVDRTMDSINEKKNQSGTLSINNSRYRKTLMYRDMDKFLKIVRKEICKQL